jgi:hypothetical protein
VGVRRRRLSNVGRPERAVGRAVAWAATWAATCVGPAVVLFVAAPVRAGDLRVTPSAAWVGTFGLEINLGCDLADTLELGPTPPTVEGNYEACSIVASQVSIGPSGAVLVGGSRISIGDGFAVPDGASLELGLDPALGVEFTSTTTHSPNAESSYTARFYLRVDDLVLGEATRIDHLDGYDGTGQPLFRLVLRYESATGRKVFDLIASHDDGGVATVSPLPLTSGWNEVAIDWSSGSGDGHFLVSVNGTPPFGVTGLSNPLSRLDEIRWGAVDGILDGAGGRLQVDDYSSWR